MANWDLILAYDTETADCLSDLGYSSPPTLRPGNRLPTTGDMKWALEMQGGLVLDYPSRDGDLYVYEQGESGFTIVIRGFDWDSEDAVPNKVFAMRWLGELQASLLIRLCERCGQLVMIQDSGGPAIVFDADMDAERVVALHRESDQHEDAWAYFFEAMYTPK